MNNEFREILKELLTDTYARTVKDNEEDFATIYYVVWKMANLMLIKGWINEEEYKQILDIKMKETRKLRNELGKNNFMVNFSYSF